MGPSIIRIQFSNGDETQGEAPYSDMENQMGILKINEAYLSKHKENIEEIPLGSTKEKFAAGDQIQLLGRAEGKLISKIGKITHSNRNYANRYGPLFEAKFDHHSNLPGAPIFNIDGKAIGMHVYSSENSVYALKIDVFNDYYKFFNNDKYDGKPYRRGDIGCSLSLVVVGNGKKDYNLPAEVAESIINHQKPSGGPPELIICSNIVPGFEIESTMKVGDIITKLDGVDIGSNLILYDEIINSHVGQSLDIEFYRYGTKMTTTVSKVFNTLDASINKYCKFANSYFHDITLYARSILNTSEKGIYLTYSTPDGNSMISSQTSLTKNNFILSKVDGVEIKNLEDLIEFLKRYCSSESISISGKDLNTGKSINMPFDLYFDPSIIQCFAKSKYGGWATQTIDLMEYCKGREEGFVNKNDDPAYEQGVSNSGSTVTSDSSEDVKDSSASQQTLAAQPAQSSATAATPATPATAATPATSNEDKSSEERKAASERKKDNKIGGLSVGKLKKTNNTVTKSGFAKVEKTKIGKYFKEANIYIK